MNKHVVLPSPAREARSPKAEIAQKDPDSAVQDAQLRRSEGRPSAEAKSLAPQPGAPAEKPQTRKTDAGQPKAPPSAATESNPFWLRPGLAAAAVLVAVVVGAILWWSSGTSESKLTYTVASVSYGTVTVSARATGTLGPRDPVDVVASASGRIESIAVKSGDRVVKGQVLARLASEASRDELARTQALLVPGQAGLARAEANVTEERAAAARNATVPGQAEAAQARLTRALADATESRALLQDAENQATAVRQRIESLDVRAPFDGIVLTSTIEPGPNVRMAVRGQPLFTLVASLAQMTLKADFPESAVGGLHAGEQAGFTVPAFPRRSFPAVLTALDLWPKKLNEDGKTRTTYSGTLVAGNADGALRPGMSADVTVITAQARNALVVPNAALAFTPPEAASKSPPPRLCSPGSAPTRSSWSATCPGGLAMSCSGLAMAA